MSILELHSWTGSASLLLFIITMAVLWVVLVVLSLRKNKIKKTVRFFVPMIIASLFLEAAAVASGRYHYPGYVLYISVIGGSVPLIILLGWSTNLYLMLAMSQYSLKRYFIDNPVLRIVLISGVAGLFGILIDLLEDPIAHHNNWWVWTQSSALSFSGVPLSNFIDWFIILFFMSFGMQLIDRSRYSENIKLVISIISVSYIGAAIFFIHTAIITIFPALGSI
jgi:uncharacterized membrane protein